MTPKPAARLVTTADRDDLISTQEKLEWTTPKMSQMDAGDTETKISPLAIETPYQGAAPS